MKTTSIVARYLLGLMFTVFGLNGFLNFIHQPPPHESTGVTVFWRHHGIAFCRVLLRGATSWWAVAALRPIRATCADTAGCGAVQHLGVSPDDVTGYYRAGSGRFRVVDSGFPAVPRKFQGHLQREGCDAGINCVAV